MTDRRSHAGEQHPEEWREDLSPEANAGQNWGGAGDVDHDAPSAADVPALRRVLDGFTKDELKRILVLPPGTRLEQGATYIDLATPDPREFTATGDMEAGSGNWFVPKSAVDYQMWNRLIGVKNPERLGDADD